MRGHLAKRGNAYSIVLPKGKDPVSGRYKYEWIAAGSDYREAENKLTKILHEKQTGVYVKPTKLTLGSYLDQWLHDYCEANLAPNTTQNYRYVIEHHIRPALGDKTLARITPEQLQRLYADKLTSGRTDKTGGLSGRSVMHIHITLHRAFKSAVKLGIMARNPADSVDPPKVKRHEMQTMSETDIHLFLEMARTTEYYPLFYTALFTGMRRSELLGLQWGNVDLPLCKISVTRTLHQLHNREIFYRQPKTVKGRRLIALSPSTSLMLREHRDRQEALRQKTGARLTDQDLVFSQLDGSPLLPDSVSQAWRRMTRRAGLTGIRLHDARHTHASLMLKNGDHPKIVQERLGHATISTTLDLYSHVAPGLQEAAAAKFDDIVIGNHRVSETTH